MKHKDIYNFVAKIYLKSKNNFLIKFLEKKDYNITYVETDLFSYYDILEKAKERYKEYINTKYIIGEKYIYNINKVQKTGSNYDFYENNYVIDNIEILQINIEWTYYNLQKNLLLEDFISFLKDNNVKKEVNHESI